MDIPYSVRKQQKKTIIVASSPQSKFIKHQSPHPSSVQSSPLLWVLFGLITQSSALPSSYGAKSLCRAGSEPLPLKASPHYHSSISHHCTFWLQVIIANCKKCHLLAVEPQMSSACSGKQDCSQKCSPGLGWGGDKGWCRGARSYRIKQ
jgi:hypothetical protein